MKTTRLAEAAILYGAREDVVAYDYETSGTSTAHDQPLQFGAARATAELEPVETYEEQIRRLPYVIPSPGAMEVTGVDVETLDSLDRATEFDAAGRIADVLAAPKGVDRTVIFFNGLSFDREMTRAMLFRNLVDPYEHERGVRTIDIYDLVRFAVSVQPDCLDVATRQDGTRAFRLSELCEANGISLDAHDGVEDALGTLAIARLIRERSPQAWLVARRSGRKATVEDHLRKACETGQPTWLFTHFSRPEVAPYLILKRFGKGDWLGVDLRAMTGDIREALLNLDTALYDPKSPLRAIRPNKAPYFLSADEASGFAPGKDSDEIWLDAERATYKAQALVAGLTSVAIGDPAPYQPKTADQTSEERIYSGFPGPDDKRAMTMFRRMVDWKSRSEVRFEDPRLRDFAARVLLATATAHEEAAYSNRLTVLEKDCEEAWSRPFRTGGDRWTSIEEARVEGNKHYRAWLGRLVGSDIGPVPAPDEPGAAPAPSKPEQLGFAF